MILEIFNLLSGEGEGEREVQAAFFALLEIILASEGALVDVV